MRKTSIFLNITSFIVIFSLLLGFVGVTPAAAATDTPTPTATTPPDSIHSTATIEFSAAGFQDQYGDVFRSHSLDTYGQDTDTVMIVADGKGACGGTGCGHFGFNPAVRNNSLTHSVGPVYYYYLATFVLDGARPSVTPSLTPTSGPSPTITPTGTPSSTPTITPPAPVVSSSQSCANYLQTPTPTATVTPTPSPTSGATPTPSPTLAHTNTPSPTVGPTPAYRKAGGDPFFIVPRCEYGILTSSLAASGSIGLFGETLDQFYTPFNEMHFHILFITSLHPITGTPNCASSFILTGQQIVPVDPSVEHPAKVDIIPGNTYKIATAGHWNDGSESRTDFSYSFDDVTYSPLNTLGGICTDFTGTYFTPSTAPLPFGQNDLYVRVNDTAGNFANNTEVDHTNDPTKYTLSEAQQIVPTTCSQQYIFDPATDILASGTINSTAQTAITPNATLTVGDMYVLQTTGDTWYDGHAPSVPRYDIRFQTAANTIDFSEASVWPYTACTEATGEAGHKRYFFQAPTDHLYMNVNDQDGNWSNNTGTPSYILYHVSTVNYWPAACETQFSINDAMYTLSIPATADAGVFLPPLAGGLPPGPGLPNPIPLNFEPGQWYMIESQDGPWGDNGPSSANPHWDLDISEDGGTNWSDFSAWGHAYCTVRTDAVGHYRVYFQQPSDDSRHYRLRVSDGPAVGNFVANKGHEDATVYRVSNIQVNPDLPPSSDACDGRYQLGQVHGSYEPVPPTDSDGIYIPYLMVDHYYGIETLNNWRESNDTVQFRAEISEDDGETWYSWQDYPGKLCLAEKSGAPPYAQLYIRVEAGKHYKVRADDVDGDFLNNSDENYGIKVFDAQVLFDPWNTCTHDYNLSLISTGRLYIPGNSVDGVRLATNPNLLYALEIYDGSWYNSGTPGDVHYDAQLSTDDGANWDVFNSPNTPGWKCSSKNGSYETVYFTTGTAYAKTRVNSPDGFDDNIGGLYYKLYAASDTGSPPDPGPYVPGSTYQSCYSTPLRPPVFSLTLPDVPEFPEIGGFGDLVAFAVDVLGYVVNVAVAIITATVNTLLGWITYVVDSVINFFLWCPEHTAALVAMYDSMQQREPFATISRVVGFVNAVVTEIQAYSWVDDNAAIVPFMVVGGGDQPDTLLPNVDSDASSPWAAGGGFTFNPDLGGGSSGLSGCSAKIKITLGTSGLAVGFCVVMNLIKGLPLLNFALNTLIVLSCIASFFRYLSKRIAPLIEPVALLTGKHR